MRVKFFLLLFRRDPNLVLHHRISHSHEVPRLQVCAARRRSCSTDALLNHFARHRVIRKFSERPPALHGFVKFLRAPEYFVQLAVDLGRRHQSWTHHLFSLSNFVIDARFVCIRRPSHNEATRNTSADRASRRNTIARPKE